MQDISPTKRSPTRWRGQLEWFGSMAAYGYLTAKHLEQLKLCDDRMWRMQEMLAERIELAFPNRFPPLSKADPG